MFVLYLIRGNSPPPIFTVVEHLLPALKILLDSNNVDILIRPILALDELCSGPRDQIDAVIASGVLPKVGHEHTVSQAYFALQETLHKVQNFGK